MQKFMMFKDLPESTQVMYPNGVIKTKEEVEADYPILATPYGVIGFVTYAKDDGILMQYYNHIYQFANTYKSQGAEVTTDMSHVEICEVITEFVNNPVSEADEALDAYLNL